MLIEIEFVEEKINVHNKRMENAIIEHRDREGIYSGMIINIDDMLFFKNIKDVDKEQKKCPIGFYLDGHNAEYDIPKLTNLKVKKTYSSFMADNIEEWHSYKNPRENFGVCDNYKQILKEYPELKKDKLNKFIVVMTPVYKKDQSSEGGWRWHKWGHYIGKYKPQYEYLYDENIDMVWVFHIFEVEYENTGDDNELCETHE